MNTSRINSFWQEFKAFAFKGNMIDLAVAVVIGAAFGNVINAIVKDLVMPIVSAVTPHTGWENWRLWRFPLGNLLSELLNFIVVAFAVFICVVKIMQALVKRVAPPPAPSEPTTRECPYCLSIIPIKARKCAHCTSEVPAVSAAPLAGAAPVVVTA